MLPLNRYALVYSARSTSLAIDELRDQLRALQMSAAELAAPSESTQSMDDHVLVCHLDSGLNTSGLLALMAPNSQMAEEVVSDHARYAFPTSNCETSTSNLRISSRLWLPSRRLIRLQLGPSLTNDSQPTQINVPVATLTLTDDSGRIEMHSRILRSKSKARFAKYFS